MASVRSAPAEKYSAPPVKITAREVESDSAPRAAVAISSKHWIDRALRRSGRLSVMTQIAPSRSTLRVWNCMGLVSFLASLGPIPLSLRTSRQDIKFIRSVQIGPSRRGVELLTEKRQP